MTLFRVVDNLELEKRLQFWQTLFVTYVNPIPPKRELHRT